MKISMYMTGLLGLAWILIISNQITRLRAILYISLRLPAIFQDLPPHACKAWRTNSAVIKGSTSDQVDGFLVIPASTSPVEENG